MAGAHPSNCIGPVTKVGQGCHVRWDRRLLQRLLHPHFGDACHFWLFLVTFVGSLSLLLVPFHQRPTLVNCRLFSIAIWFTSLSNQIKNRHMVVWRNVSTNPNRWQRKNSSPADTGNSTPLRVRTAVWEGGEVGSLRGRWLPTLPRWAPRTALELVYHNWWGLLVRQGAKEEEEVGKVGAKELHSDATCRTWRRRHIRLPLPQCNRLRLKWLNYVWWYIWSGYMFTNETSYSFS